MRAVVQRVKEAWVEVRKVRVGAIGLGLLVYLGVRHTDEAADVDYLCERIAALRIFEDDAGKMNLSVRDNGASLLIVSQFTLYGDCRRGKRPSFSEAAAQDKGKALYELAVERFRSEGLRVETGIFREMMEVYSINSGPVTLLLDSDKSF
jgi:D-tyrosyl-tRNA(Tyr) deacylase